MTIEAIKNQMDEAIDGLDCLTHIPSAERCRIRELMEDVQEALGDAQDNYGDEPLDETSDDDF